MNDVYLSYKPIHEHFRFQRAPYYRLLRFVLYFKKNLCGCYCFAVKKIAINTKNIIKFNMNPGETLDHETMHYILHKYFDMHTSYQWDNIADSVLEYIWMDLYDTEANLGVL